MSYPTERMSNDKGVEFFHDNSRYAILDECVPSCVICSESRGVLAELNAALEAEENAKSNNESSSMYPATRNVANSGTRFKYNDRDYMFFDTCTPGCEICQEAHDLLAKLNGTDAVESADTKALMDLQAYSNRQTTVIEQLQEGLIAAQEQVTSLLQQRDDLEGVVTRLNGRIDTLITNNGQIMTDRNTAQCERDDLLNLFTDLLFAAVTGTRA